MKTLVILVDGMRPDALIDIPEVEEFKASSSYCLNSQTVMPSVTLPCHMSLFHSVDPSRHGTTTNTYAPQVRPIDGICEVLNAAKKKCAMFYNWHQLRDLARPGTLVHEYFFAGRLEGYEVANPKVTDAAIEYIRDYRPDFAFLYLGWPDAAGHGYGWMGEEYMHSIKESWKCIKKVSDSLDDEYAVIVTADHGGHDRSHGTDMPEDMLIPIFFKGTPFEKGKALEGISIKDIAPTVAALCGVEPAEEWEGRSATAGIVATN